MNKAAYLEARRQIRMKLHEISMMKGNFELILERTRDLRGKAGDGVLVMQMDPSQRGAPTFWLSLEEINTAATTDQVMGRIMSMVERANPSRNILAVMFSYITPRRTALYLLDLNVGDACREMIGGPFWPLDIYINEPAGHDEMDEMDDEIDGDLVNLI